MVSIGQIDPLFGLVALALIAVMWVIALVRKK